MISLPDETKLPKIPIRIKLNTIKTISAIKTRLIRSLNRSHFHAKVNHFFLEKLSNSNVKTAAVINGMAHQIPASVPL